MGKTMIQTTSTTAFADVKKNIGKRQMKVLETIQEYGPVSNNLISKYADMSINCVTPRVHELRALNKVVEVYKAEDITGRRAIFWGTHQQKREHEKAKTINLQEKVRFAI